MRFRGYCQGDVEAMYRLDLLCFTGPFQFDRLTMMEAAEDPAAIVVVFDGKVSHEIAGFVIVHMEGAAAERCAYIVTIDVAPELRRSGIGSAMLKRAEEKARGAGAARIALHVATDNSGAIEFYKRQLYRPAGVAERFYREAGLDAFIFTKQLQASPCVS